MRVLLTTDTIGGVWTFTRELSAELLSRGHAVCLLSFGRSPSSGQLAWTDATIRSNPGSFFYKSSKLPLEWMQENAAAYTAALPLLENSIDEFSPDLLHLNQFCFGAFPHPLPRLITAHSDVLSWAATCLPGARLEPSSWLDRYTALVRPGLAQADAVVVPTHWMADQLDRHFAMGPAPEVIHNGRTLPPHSSGSTQPYCHQAVTAGRLWDQAKNTALLQELDSPLPIYIAGDQGYPGESSRIGAIPPPPSHLHFMGPLQEPALLDLFRASALYIATSRYEPFGLAPLEAALCGCAVLANDIPSLREVWGEAALYFQDGSGLENLLRQLTADPDLLRAARTRSLVRAQSFTAAQMAEGYLSLYHRLLQASPDHPAAPALPLASHVV